MNPNQIKTKTDLHNSLAGFGYKIGVEVGSYRGDGAESLLLESALERVFTIDYWNHSRKSDLSNFEDYLHCTAKLFKYGMRCVPLKMEACEAANLFKDGSVCYVYIDAGLEYDEYLLAIETWWPKVKRGGMIAGRLFDWVILSKQMIETDASIKAVEFFSKSICDKFSVIADRLVPDAADLDNFKGSRSWYVTKKCSNTSFSL
tara:strand:+ start:524 stop:1132 length:609 start_codon:yes stop_codon:yes gene_type:complete